MGGRCQFSHNIHWMNHCLPLVQDVPVAWDPRGLSLGCQWCLLCPDFHIWLPCCVSCGMFQRCLAEPLGIIVCDMRTCACCSGCAGDRRWKSLTRPWLWWAWSSFVQMRGLMRQSQWDPVSDRWALDLVGIFVYPLQVLSSQHQCKGTEWWVGCRITAYAPFTLTQVLPLVLEQWKVDDLCRFYSALLNLLTDWFALALM